jgi:molybdopterin converting factor small subunit
MPMIRIPTPLRSYTAGESEVTVQGGNVNQALESLMQLHPTLRPHLYSTSGQLRPFVNLFLNEDNIRDLQGLETPLQDGDRLMLIPSIAGGSSHVA